MPGQIQPRRPPDWLAGWLPWHCKQYIGNPSQHPLSKNTESAPLPIYTVLKSCLIIQSWLVWETYYFQEAYLASDSSSCSNQSTYSSSTADLEILERWCILCTYYYIDFPPWTVHNLSFFSETSSQKILGATYVQEPRIYIGEFKKHAQKSLFLRTPGSHAHMAHFAHCV